MNRVVVPFTAAFALVACSKLTEPPKPEPFQEPGSVAEKAAAAAAAPASAAAPANPHAKPEDKPAPPAAPPSNEKVAIKDITVGKGPEVKAGDTLKVHYTGTLTDGKEFDSSKKPGREPFEITLGVSNVIKGWHDGITGMKLGGKRRLTIPPSLAYGPGGRPPVIPPNATLIFDVEVLEVKKK